MNSRNTPAPIPHPTRFTCSNCGFGWDERAPVCPRCGEAQTPAKRKMSTGRLVMSICGILVCGVVGAFFTLIGIANYYIGVDPSLLNPLSFSGAVLLGLTFYFCLKMARKA